VAERLDQTGKQIDPVTRLISIFQYGILKSVYLYIA